MIQEDLFSMMNILFSRFAKGFSSSSSRAVADEMALRGLSLEGPNSTFLLTDVCLDVRGGGGEDRDRTG